MHRPRRDAREAAEELIKELEEPTSVQDLRRKLENYRDITSNTRKRPFEFFRISTLEGAVRAAARKLKCYEKDTDTVLPPS